MTRTSGSAGGAGRITLSANLLLVGLIFNGLGFAIGGDLLDGAGAAFVFVMAGWVLGLCLHAFGPLLVSGNPGLPGTGGLATGGLATGVLAIDPARAPNPVATMLLPVVFTILVGLGFPGGVSEAEAAGPSRGRRSAVAAAGPAMSLLFLILLVGLYALTSDESGTLRAVLAVSVLFQGTALVLGLMPVPGLDGYAILRPWLPGDWSWTDRVARHSALVLLGLFLLSGAFTRPVFRVSLRLTAGLGIDLADVITGYRLIRLW
ncbi:site-2 protease family protein [Methylobacterium sp. J-068]|uniref:site-2 protease family protein n=1 Tax=Methylobacterium sp. J-068 TaxID=2836649 RepID=UPI001FB8DAF1|nr:site-2 protease family protein [Methylobacterium sp. J-068]MCJ2033959.1 site-2 protease family protein [Methylobacterium sp. J-068]